MMNMPCMWLFGVMIHIPNRLSASWCVVIVIPRLIWSDSELTAFMTIKPAMLSGSAPPGCITIQQGMELWNSRTR